MMKKKIVMMLTVASMLAGMAVPAWGSEPEPVVVEEEDSIIVSEEEVEQEVIEEPDSAPAEVTDIFISAAGKRDYYYGIDGYMGQISLAGYEFTVQFGDGSVQKMKIGDYIGGGMYLSAEAEGGGETLDDNEWLLPGEYKVNVNLIDGNSGLSLASTSVDIRVHKLDLEQMALLQPGQKETGKFFLDDNTVIYSFWSDKGGTYLFPLEAESTVGLSIQKEDLSWTYLPWTSSYRDYAFYNMEPYTHYYVILQNSVINNSSYTIGCEKALEPEKLELLEYPKTLKENEAMEAQFANTVKAKVTYDNGEEKILTYNNETDGNGNMLILDYDKVNIWKSFTDRSARPGTHTITACMGYIGDDEWMHVYPTSKTAKASFKVQAGGSVSLKQSTLKLEKTSLAYTGKNLTPAVTVKCNGVTLKKNSDYTVTYKNNKNIGKATATVKGKGIYTGSKSVNFKIVPKKVTVTSVKAQGKGKVKVSWKKDNTVGGYQIYTSAKKNEGYKKAKTVSGNKNVAYTLSKQKKGKLYVKVRSYKKVGSTYYYGAFSAAKAVTVK